jgi:hypothetical protein
MAISTINYAKTTGVITSGTAVASTSGTSIDFTGIPSWAKRVTVMLNGVGTNGTSNVQIQVGAGSVVTTGYFSDVTVVGTGGYASQSATTGFYLENGGNASALRRGIVTLCLVGSNTWACSFSLGFTAALNQLGGGNITLSGALDRIRLTTVNGTDTFSAGSVNILYE